MYLIKNTLNKRAIFTTASVKHSLPDYISNKRFSAFSEIQYIVHLNLGQTSRITILIHWLSNTYEGKN